MPLIGTMDTHMIQINVCSNNSDIIELYNFLLFHVTKLVPLKHLHILIQMTDIIGNDINDFFTRSAKKIGFWDTPSFKISKFRINKRGYLTIALQDPNCYIDSFKKMFRKKLCTSSYH